MKVEKVPLSFTFCLLIISFFLCCKQAQNSDQQTAGKKQMQKIALPDSLIVYNPNNAKLIEIKKLSEKRLKIYSFIDVSCPSCLTSIERWAQIVIELNKYDVPVILVCQSEDNYELLKYLCEKNEIPEMPMPFYFDTKNQFLKKNKFLNSAPNEHTILVDKNNLVLLSGDPTLSKKIENLYFDTIKSYN